MKTAKAILICAAIYAISIWGSYAKSSEQVVSKIKRGVTKEFRAKVDNGKVVPDELINDFGLDYDYRSAITEYIFDKRGHMVEMRYLKKWEQPLDSTAKVVYTYDKNGRKTSRKYTVGVASPMQKEETWKYDKKGILTSYTNQEVSFLGGCFVEQEDYFYAKSGTLDSVVYNCNGAHAKRVTTMFSDGKVTAQVGGTLGWPTAGLNSSTTKTHDGQRGEPSEWETVASNNLGDNVISEDRYKYNEKGDWVEIWSYYNGRPTRITIREIEYFE